MEAHRAAASAAAGFAVDTGVTGSQLSFSQASDSRRATRHRSLDGVAVENLRRINHTANQTTELFGAM